MINVFQPSLGEEEVEAVRKVFASNWIGRGEVSVQFEAEFAKHIGASHRQMLSISSCTEGLFLSMRVLDIGPGDEVILPSISFIGAGEAVLSCGATPVFCDVDRHSLNPTLDHIRKEFRRDTKAVLLLHYGGNPCRDIWQIEAFCREKGIHLIEDSACSVASRSKGQACGRIGEIGLWSFDAMKILCTGDGGMMYFRYPEMRAKAESMAWLCTKNKSGISTDDEDWWQVSIDGVGHRILMNDITAAIGLEQLKKLPGFIARRKEIHRMYNKYLVYPWIKRPPSLGFDEQSSYYFYWIQLPSYEHRKLLADHLRQNGIYCTFRYWPLHMIGYFGVTWKKLSGVEQAAYTVLNLPIHQSLTDDEVYRICNTIQSFGAEHQW